MHTHYGSTTNNRVIFDLWSQVNTIQWPAMKYMCTDFGVDSSSWFPFRAWTHIYRHTQKVMDVFDHPHALAAAGVGNRHWWQKINTLCSEKSGTLHFGHNFCKCRVDRFSKFFHRQTAMKFSMQLQWRSPLTWTTLLHYLVKFENSK